jgi:glycosyltransferase involved in cell wall biosynthesis
LNLQNKIKVIYNPLNPVFQPLEKPFSAKPIILQVGTKVVKNLERLITALEGINCHLHIIGMLSDGQKKRLERYQIEFTNEVSLSTFEMKRAYENCDIVSFVSLYEGFGMPIMEANAIGRVVITGNRTSIPEVAKNAALLINPLNMEAIRNGILKLINDDNYRNQLIQNGFENVKRFDVKMITKQYLELYEEVYDNFKIQ